MSDCLHLIDAQSLRADPDCLVFDCRFNLAAPGWGRRIYREGHIPGACYADLDLDLSRPIGPDTGRHPLPDVAELAHKLGAWGLDRTVRAVVYDDAGGAFAARLWWLLRWFGHPHVALLDGGLQAWLESGGTLSTKPTTPTPRTFLPQIDERAWVSTADLVAGLAADRFQVIDARAPARFSGESEPIDPVAGHIPGAINLPLQGNLDADGRFLPPGQLRARFTAALGDRPSATVVHSCGSGVNACHNLLAMEAAGLTGSHLYAGSWSEWIRDPRRPVARGV